MKLYEVAQQVITLYHVTQTQNVDKIKREGITHFNPSNWVKAGSKERYGEGDIYAFDSEKDAVRWAAKMDWEFNQQMGSGKISVVSFKADPRLWKEDISDPLGQAGAEGKWLKSHAAVKPSQIVGGYPVTSDRIKSVVRS